MTGKRVINFGAGPAKIPETVMEQAEREFRNFNGTGIGVAETSHRSAQFTELLNSTKKLFVEELHIPSNYEVLFLHGGGTGQFAGVPLNLSAFSKNKEQPTADYIVTGAWSGKAVDEAKKFIHVNKVFEPTKPYTGPPVVDTWKRDPDAAYLYYCANETVHGIEFPKAPETLPGVPLVADVSSNFISKRFDFTDHGIVLGGAQKNLGTAGLTVAIVRQDLIGKEQPITPGILSYAEMLKNNSVYNTPSTFSIYITKLVLEWIRENGGVDGLAERNQAKADLLYQAIDNSDGFYSNNIVPEYRSRMNIPFRVGGGDADLEAAFIKEATAAGMLCLKGHRSVGGIRASIYNSVTLDEVQVLVDFMAEFKAKH
uniref:Phosphoserine aminotransferase n=1 Tax=Panagrellus redivivus TaxID=6233 RepID=A0A7E4V9P8_PANRE